MISRERSRFNNSLWLPRVTCLAFSADGKTLASGSGDETVKLWNVAVRTERTTLRGHHGGITAVAFAPDGRMLASAGVDDAVRLWEIRSP